MSSSGFADQLWQPATFLERGVAVPFTTPMLAGARARPAKRGVELVVPHPAGARGVYIMPLMELSDFCAATLHDVCLAERISRLPAFSPHDITLVARLVAAGGAAGRPARAAAHLAEDAQTRARLGATALLLGMLVQQATGSACAPAELDRRGKAAIVVVGADTGRSPADISNYVERLAGLFTRLGLGPAADKSPCGRLMLMIGALRPPLERQAAVAANRAAVAAALVISGADSVMRVAGPLLAESRRLAENLPSLLAMIGRDETGTMALLSRAEWMLDGWEQICLIHQTADDRNMNSAVSEMALIVPVMPRQADEWAGHPLDEGDRQHLRKVVHGFEDWRTGGVVFDLIARNERLRAMAA